MSTATLIIISIIFLIIGYQTYGTYVAKVFDLKPERETPAHSMYDGVDYCPAKAPVLLGHHFASIAGAAPIIGPIVAAAFGWVPVAIWLLFGSVFIGAVHDFSSLVASARHKGKSIGSVVEDNIGRNGKLLFLLFCWSALILVIAVFTIVVAKTFSTVPSAATSSILFILLAVCFGFALHRAKCSLTTATILGVFVLFVCLWLGMWFPVSLTMNTWIILIIGYIVVASVTPVWILLQPRDYLNSFLLYIAIACSVFGIVTMNPKIELPAFTGFHVEGLGSMFPVLFVTVACGAISGFHSLVASGTTSKQLDKEPDAKMIGYGGMLIEALLGIIALITVSTMSLGQYKELLKDKGPVAIFAQGVGQFMTSLNIPLEVGTSLAALTVSAFALTSLDTATRLGRYTLQEFFHNPEREKQSILHSNRFISTGITVLCAGSLAMTGTWKMIWPLFGTANQLLAAIAFLALMVWVIKLGKGAAFLKLPMVFMFLVTTTALISLIQTNLSKKHYILSIVGSLLLVLSMTLLYQGYRKISKKSLQLAPETKS